MDAKGGGEGRTRGAAVLCCGRRAGWLQKLSRPCHWCQDMYMYTRDWPSPLVKSIATNTIVGRYNSSICQSTSTQPHHSFPMPPG